MQCGDCLRSAASPTWKCIAPINSKSVRNFESAKPSPARFNRLSRMRFFKRLTCITAIAAANGELIPAQRADDNYQVLFCFVADHLAAHYALINSSEVLFHRRSQQ